ncbi:MAG: thiamine phosphate synthase [Polyangiaceae bacterium]|nr:thiamine phosphate synthase [Polyangiaceae bacterium]
MTPPRLIVITDGSRGTEATLLERVERALALARPTTVLVQLRDHQLPGRDRLALGRRLVALARRHGQRFGVNDRLDLARMLGADSVHLGEASVSLADARRLMPDAWITRAWHGGPEPEADALVLSPIFEPRHGRPALGVGALGGAKLPVYALGGVTAERAARARSAGAAGVAVVGAVLGDDDPTALCDALGILR